MKTFDQKIYELEQELKALEAAFELRIQHRKFEDIEFVRGRIHQLTSSLVVLKKV